MTTASGICAQADRARRSMPGGASAAAHRHDRAHAPSMWPPTTAAAGRSRRGPAAATRRPARGRPCRTGPSRAGTGRRSRSGCAGRRSAGTSGSGRSGSRGRSAAGRRRSPRRRRPRVSDQGREHDEAQAAEQEQRLSATPGAPNRSNQIWVCDSPSNRIDPTPSATRTTSGRRPNPGSSRPLAERPATDAAVLVGQRERREAAEEPEPDREGLAVRAPRVAPELGHHRERERRVADEHDEQRRRARRRRHELQPDERGERDRPPATCPSRGRVVGRRPAAHVEAAQHPGADVVQGRERIEEVPDRPDGGRDERRPRPSRRPTGTAARPSPRSRRRRSPGPRSRPRPTRPEGAQPMRRTRGGR